MKTITYIASASILLTSFAPALAADMQAQFKDECMSEMNLETDEGLSAPTLFYLRRCVVKKKNALQRQDMLRRDRMRNQIRMQDAEEQVIDDVRARRSRREIRTYQRMQYLRSIQSPRRRTRGKDIKREISRERAVMRRDTQSKDREESRIHTNRIEAIREIQAECRGLFGNKRRDCVYKLLHNLNLWDK